MLEDTSGGGANAKPTRSTDRTQAKTESRRPKSTASVLVIGASKGIGLETVKQALAAGHSVRAFARSADQIEVEHPALEKRVGSALEADGVVSALRGVKTVIQTLGVTTSPEMVLKPAHLFSEATRILLPAMEIAGVRRLVCLTGYGAGDSLATMGLLRGLGFQVILGRVYQDKTLQERLIRRSALDWVIARPGILTNGPKTGRYRVLPDRDQWKLGTISRADVADFLVKQIDDDTYLGKTPVLTS